MNIEKESILVTGGAGFIGSHLVEQLVRRGYKVRVLDVLSRGSLEHIQPLINNKEIEYIDGDIRYRGLVDSAMEGVGFVFHMAATNINRSIAYPEESFDVNFRGAAVVFNSALVHNVKKVMFASSASVYGEPEKLPMSEDHKPNPVTPYCISKLACEHLLKFLSRYGLKYICFRYFNVYGLRQHTDAYYTSVIILFLRKLLDNKPPVIIGNGDQSMDFVNVEDVVRANIMGMESDVENEVFNVGSGKSTTIKELAHILATITEKNIDPVFEPRDVVVAKRKADVRKAMQLLGFDARTGLEEGLKRLLQDMLKHPERY